MEIRNGLTQDFEALAGKIGALKRHSGDVAAWMCEIGDKTAANRIVSHRKDNRNGPRRPLQRRNARSIRNNDIDVLLHELGRNLCNTFGSSLRPAILDGDAAALDPAQLRLRPTTQLLIRSPRQRAQRIVFGCSPLLSDVLTGSGGVEMG